MHCCLFARKSVARISLNRTEQGLMSIHEKHRQDDWHRVHVKRVFIAEGAQHNKEMGDGR